MSECRALTNMIGNGVATVVISRWEGELTPATLNANLDAATARPQSKARNAVTPSEEERIVSGV
jgi:aerobic C4-dicarboxylate transport protein